MFSNAETGNPARKMRQWGFVPLLALLLFVVPERSEALGEPHPNILYAGYEVFARQDTGANPDPDGPYAEMWIDPDFTGRVPLSYGNLALGKAAYPNGDQIDVPIPSWVNFHFILDASINGIDWLKLGHPWADFPGTLFAYNENAYTFNVAMSFRGGFEFTFPRYLVAMDSSIRAAQGHVDAYTYDDASGATNYVFFTLNQTHETPEPSAGFMSAAIGAFFISRSRRKS